MAERESVCTELDFLPSFFLRIWIVFGVSDDWTAHMG